VGGSGRIRGRIGGRIGGREHRWDGIIDGREHGIGKKSGPSNREGRSIEGPSNQVLVARCVAVEDRSTNPWEDRWKNRWEGASME
jgi:hypothetical protein